VGGESYVRQATIPHGDALLAQSTFFTTVAGGPTIKPVNSLPFSASLPIPGLNGDASGNFPPPEGTPYIDQFLNPTLPAAPFLTGLNAADTVKDPTIVLRAAIASQKIVNTVVIAISTATPGNIVNIPFVQKNANAAQMDAIFWIETVERPDGQRFMQLQYVQRVILDFIGIHWPHISVATLRKL
jgi:hypothetical protein